MENLPINDLRRDTDLLERPPGWMLYWGSAAVVGLLVALLLVAAWVRYPVRVVVPVRITSVQPPLAVVVPEAGIIQTLWAQDGDTVAAQAPLLLLHNPAHFADVQHLDSLLQQWAQWDSPAAVLAVHPPDALQLGTLDEGYTLLTNHIHTLQLQLTRQYGGQRAAQWQLQRQRLTDARQTLAQQVQHQREEVAIAQRNAQQFRQLFERQTASQLEVDAAEIRLLRAQQELQNLEGRLLDNEGRQAALADNILAVTETKDETTTAQWLAVMQHIRLLRLGVRTWEQRYLVRAPAAGRVGWVAPLQAGQPIASQTVALRITPIGTPPNYTAEGQLPGIDYGELHPGDTAYIRLDAFPHRIYGQLPARVERIAQVPSDATGTYRLVLTLPQGLTTGYGRTLPFRYDMPAQAIILGEDRSLLGRIVQRVW